jgi:CheY-like chemotaxis protein
MLNELKILLVDDYPDTQLFLKRLLTKCGALVDVADNGQEAITKAGNQEYDVVLMDVEMPGMDGVETMRVLRDHSYTKPIIALTAHAIKSKLDLIGQSGFNGYLVKPFEMKDLDAMLNKVMERI